MPIELDANRIPRHIALIMDGNGRWAKKRLLPRAMGHRAGVLAIRPLLEEADALGVRAVTLYAFSTENWKRPAQEVSALMGLLVEFFNSEIDKLHEKNVRIGILGDSAPLPEAARRAMDAAIEKTRGNTGVRLSLALNYGGRAELTRAARLLAQRVVEGALAPQDITEADMQACLYTHDLPDVDLVVRTAGEMRLSNFLPWQAAYAEYVALDCLWPDFDKDALRACIAEYQKRTRKFGGLEQ